MQQKGPHRDYTTNGISDVHFETLLIMIMLYRSTYLGIRLGIINQVRKVVGTSVIWIVLLLQHARTPWPPMDKRPDNQKFYSSTS